MNFRNMVGFLIKYVLAAIPTFFILGLITLFIFGMLGHFGLL